MKIRSLYIDGFGKFHDWKPPTEFGESLTVIFGPNEAGKTTLLAFIRRMLYGFPDGRKNLNHYPPINGGKIGGRLEILGEDGQEYILSRTGVRGVPSLTYAGGTAVKGIKPLSLLGPCDQVFYENVCAIGLNELQEISTLRRDEIRDRLAAAGAGNLPVREVSTSIQRAADGIYVIQGKRKKINTLMSELKDVEAKIRDVKKRQGEYDLINEAITRESKAALEEDEKRKSAEEEITCLKSLAQAWEIFLEREKYRDALSKIPGIEPFPAGALEDLSKIEAEIKWLESEREDLTRKQSSSKEELERCVVREEVLAQADNIRALERKVEHYRNQVDDLKGVRLGLEQQQASLASMLKSFGEGWDEERVIRFDTSVPAQDEAKQLRDRLTKSMNDCTAQRSRLEAAEREAAEKREDLRDLKRRRDDIGDVEDPVTARKRLSLSREMLGEIQRVQELEVRLQTIRQEEARTAEIRASLRSARGLPSWPGILVALSAVLVFLWGFFTAAIQIAGLIALILLVAAAGIFLAGRGAEGGNDTEVPAEKGETLAAQRKEVEREISAGKEKIRSCAKLLGFDPPHERTVAEDLVHTLEDAVMEAGRASDLDRDIARAEELCRTADEALKKARKAMDDLRSEHKKALDAWKRWCSERGLPGAMNPDLLPDLIAEIKQAAGLCAQIAAMKKREESLSAEIRLFEEEIAAVARACNEPLKGSPEVILEGLIRLLHDEEEAKRRYHALGDRLNAEGEALERTVALYAAAKADLETILKERGVETPEEYREIERLSRERQKLEESIRDAGSAIRRISGVERYDDFITALQGYDPVQMQVRLKEKENELQEIREKIQDIHQEIGTLRERCSGIEGDDELTSLLSHEAALKEDLSRVSREWSVYTVASSLLGMAVETFERERQPEILMEAQSFFTAITGGRYTRVVKPFDGSDPYVEEATGARKKIDELSRGTAEQLYLALRFGYIRDYATSSIPVPVIFDDILVNFDPVRRKNACRAIAELAETCQVIYFTCHPHAVEDLVEATPDAVVMDLSAE
ncbi:AAA family ATPase [Methanoculleus sp.]|uniref:ATP-binding protein n=1 Tax=Methanoculleus sp. TaxID=90427 RepID=UPI00260B27FF|nr:AAA family ATPase [Methanoculleus sp.]MDI6867878.1 AAA family ATPase [Methanoculleus sp.]